MAAFCDSLWSAASTTASSPGVLRTEGRGWQLPGSRRATQLWHPEVVVWSFCHLSVLITVTFPNSIPLTFRTYLILLLASGPSFHPTWGAPVDLSRPFSSWCSSFFFVSSLSHCGVSQGCYLVHNSHFCLYAAKSLIPISTPDFLYENHIHKVSDIVHIFYFIVLYIF